MDEKGSRDDFSMEVSKGVRRARPINIRPNVPEGIIVVNTEPYPKGDHPFEKMSRQTMPYELRLRKLLIELSGGDNARTLQNEKLDGIPSKPMEKDLGTVIAKQVDVETVYDLRTGEYQEIGEGETLLFDIAREVAANAKMVISEMDTEKIEVDEFEMPISQDIAIYFDGVVAMELSKVLPDERLQILLVLNSLRDEICSQIVEVSSGEARLRYSSSLKNAIKYIVDSVMQNGINKSITLELPNV